MAAVSPFLTASIRRKSSTEAAKAVNESRNTIDEQLDINVLKFICDLEEMRRVTRPHRALRETAQEFKLIKDRAYGCCHQSSPRGIPICRKRSTTYPQ